MFKLLGLFVWGMIHDVIIATVCAGEWELMYVDGELRKEGDEISAGDIGEEVDGLIDSIEEEWRIGDVESYNAPETYGELCEVTDS